MVQRQAEFLSFGHNLCINCPADLAISRLVPFWSKAISSRASPPIGFTDTISPSPKALWNTRSPAAKFGSGLLLAAEASDALGAVFAAETYRARGFR